MVELFFGIFLYPFKIVIGLINRDHPNSENELEQNNNKQIDTQHEQVGERVLIVNEDASCDEREEGSKDGGNAHVVNGG